MNDPDAAFLGGVSGNAGLFATARDVGTVYQMLLNKGEIDGKRYLGAETCRIFTTTTSKSGRRDLGYDKPFPKNPKHSPCCISAPPVVYGHTGYTGTCCWVDPLNRLDKTVEVVPPISVQVVPGISVEAVPLYSSI